MRLNQAGILDVTIDLGLPCLAEAVLGDELTAMDAAVKDEMFRAISNRDITRLTKLPLKAAPHCGNRHRCVWRGCRQAGEVAKILPDAAAEQLSGLIDIATSLNGLLPDIAITLDPLDMQGYGYHTSVSFSVFGAGLKGAIAKWSLCATGYDEKAMGLSVFMERVLRSLPTRRRHLLFTFRQLLA